MLERFLSYIKNQGLIRTDDSILLAVSGGIDSMSLLELFIQAQLNFSVAHCNFQLRGAESEGDQKFLEEYCSKKNIRLFTKRFDTTGFASDTKVSIQMAARELRYTWFEEICKEYGYQKIAVAHNKNDVVETFLINMTRGTGIRGLTGIKPITGKLIRPLIFATRIEIADFVAERNIPYREDSSNSELKYLRNKIRHEILPLFEALNPSFLSSIVDTAHLLSDTEVVFTKHIASLTHDLSYKSGDIIYLIKSQMQKHSVSPAILYEILSPFNFSLDAATRIIQAIPRNSGLVFYSSTHKLVNDREHFIIKELDPEDRQTEFYINENEFILDVPVHLKISRYGIDKSYLPNADKRIASFDLDKINFPLKIRKWKNGDYFYPFGMKGRKKLSNYFTDHKFSLIDKENCWVMCNNEDIIWIINHRTDERYKIEKETSRILQIELIL